MFYIKYLIMYKVHMHAGAIRKLLYGCAYVLEIIHSLKLVDYLPVHTHKPYNNIHLFCIIKFKLKYCLYFLLLISIVFISFLFFYSKLHNHKMNLNSNKYNSVAFKYVVAIIYVAW